MKKYLILFCTVFVCVSVFCSKNDYGAKDTVESDAFEDVLGYYHQILLKKWQENINWQKMMALR